MPKNQQNPRAKPDRPGGQRPGSARSAANRKRFAERQAAKQQAALQARRDRNRLIGLTSVVLAVVIVAALIIVKVAGGGGGSSASVSSPPAGTAVPAATMSRLASIPVSTLVSAPTGGVVTPVQAISDPSLKVDGKPELLYIGAEYCPICATERWAMYVALSKFGTFSPQPGRIHSAVRDGDIETLTFYKTRYTSPYLTFTPVETTTNQPDGASYVTLQTPTTDQLKLWESHTDQSYPWLDFGGKEELTSAQFNPEDLVGESFNQIASDIGNNSTTIGAAVDASAKVLIQTICKSMTGGKPASVCGAVGDG